MKADEAIAELLNSLNRGQYLLMAESIRQLGGEMSIDLQAFDAAANAPLPIMEVDASEGAVRLRLGGPSSPVMIETDFE